MFNIFKIVCWSAISYLFVFFFIAYAQQNSSHIESFDWLTSGLEFQTKEDEAIAIQYLANNAAARQRVKSAIIKFCSQKKMKASLYSSIGLVSQKEEKYYIVRLKNRFLNKSYVDKPVYMIVNWERDNLCCGIKRTYLIKRPDVDLGARYEIASGIKNCALECATLVLAVSILLAWWYKNDLERLGNIIIKQKVNSTINFVGRRIKNVGKFFGHHSSDSVVEFFLAVPLTFALKWANFFMEKNQESELDYENSIKDKQYDTGYLYARLFRKKSRLEGDKEFLLKWL